MKFCQTEIVLASLWLSLRIPLRSRLERRRKLVSHSASDRWRSCAQMSCISLCVNFLLRPGKFLHDYMSRAVIIDFHRSEVHVLLAFWIGKWCFLVKACRQAKWLLLTSLRPFRKAIQKVLLQKVNLLIPLVLNLTWMRQLQTLFMGCQNISERNSVWSG